MPKSVRRPTTATTSSTASPTTPRPAASTSPASAGNRSSSAASPKPAAERALHRAPIGRDSVIPVHFDFAVAIAPIEILIGRVGGRAGQLLVGEVELVGAERAVIGEPRPRDRQVLLAHSQEAAEA